MVEHLTGQVFTVSADISKISCREKFWGKKKLERMIGNRRLQKESKTQVKCYETMQTKSLTEYDSGGEERKQLLAKLNFSAIESTLPEHTSHWAFSFSYV